MKEQKWEITKIPTFDVKNIFECGQCFRWNKEKEDSYIGVFGTNILRIRQEEKKIYFEGVNQQDKDLKEICRYYFDMERDYENLQKKLKKEDSILEKSIQYGEGIRILNQDLWETIISFIISANNNIPRIKGIIERLSQNYGTPIRWKHTTYYTFPSPEELAKASIEDLRRLGLGFRDKRVYETTKMIIEKQVDLQKLQEEKDFEKIRNTLLSLSGVGEKVADCILLFSTLKRLEAFPVDVWVKRVMNELYIHKENITNKEIQEIAYQKFGELRGLAQQYLFYWRREA